jgi:hypothetical protein
MSSNCSSDNGHTVPATTSQSQAGFLLFSAAGPDFASRRETPGDSPVQLFFFTVLRKVVSGQAPEISAFIPAALILMIFSQVIACS